MITVKNPTDNPVRAVDPSGVYATYIQPNETKAIRDPMLADACAKGCVPAEAGVDNPATESDENKVAELVEAINTILDAGDPSLLTSTGCPKASELTDLIGKHTAAERDAAYEQVKAERPKQDA